MPKVIDAERIPPQNGVRIIETDLGLTFHEKPIGPEGHTFITVHTEQGPTSSLVLAPTEVLHVTEIGNDVVLWLRQRTGCPDLEVEARGQKVGIITDTQNSTVFKLVDLGNPTQEVPSWVEEGDNVFKQLEGHEKDDAATQAAKSRAKAVVIDYIGTLNGNGNDRTAVNDGVSIIPVTSNLRNQVATVTDLDLLSKQAYLVVEETQNQVRFLAPRVGRPKTIAGHAAELTVRENGSGPISLGKFVQVVAERTSTNGVQINPREIKSRVVTQLSYMLIGRHNDKEAPQLAPTNEASVIESALRRAEQRLGATIAEPIAEYLIDKNQRAAERLRQLFDETYGQRELHPLVDFNDLPEAVVEMLIQNPQDKALFKTAFVQFFLRKAAEDTMYSDTLDRYERVGIEAVGGANEAVERFKAHFAQTYIALEREEDFSQLLQQIDAVAEDQGVVMQVSGNDGQLITLNITPDQVQAIGSIKPQYRSKEAVASVIAKDGFRQEMIGIGLQAANHVGVTEAAIDYTALGKEVAETIALAKERDVRIHGSARLGAIHKRTDIRSTEGPFNWFPEVRVEYPQVVIDALGDLYGEFNEAFRSLVELNREHPSDYQLIIDENGTPINGWVQIDMNGLTQARLDELAKLSREEVRELLRNEIFESENSLAMYGLLSGIFAKAGQDTEFKKVFRSSLNALRQKHGKKIAVLGVTQAKYIAMRESEFGKRNAEPLTETEVMEISGFDALMGPDEFRALVEKGEVDEWIFYVRSSDPLTKLKDPTVQIEGSLLEDPELRQIIKANSLTFNIDDPNWPVGSPRLINDTKAYLPSIGMAVEVSSTAQLKAHLASQGISEEDINSGKVVLRAKPGAHSYGCYGHLRSHEEGFWSGLERGFAERGSYVVQREIKTPLIYNESDGIWYTYIDRNFFAWINGKPVFMSGFRFYMPADSNEAKNGRVHGADDAVLAEVAVAA